MAIHRPETKLERAFRAVLRPLSRYHNYRVVGMDRLPAEGAFLLAVNHSFATYDGFLLGMTLKDAIPQEPVGIGDNLLFTLPGWGGPLRSAGLFPANPPQALQLLRDGHPVMLAPGGMREALRPNDERDRILWDRRKGFARLAVQAGVPLVLAACGGADEIYRVYDNPLTAWAYREFRVPVPVVRGLGPTLLPRKVPLVHVIGEPLVPRAVDAAQEDEEVDRLHRAAVEQMNRLLEASRRAIAT